MGSGASWLRLGWEPGFDGGYPQNFSLTLRPIDPLSDAKLDAAPLTFSVPSPGPQYYPGGRRFKRYVNDVFHTLVKFNATSAAPCNRL